MQDLIDAAHKLGMMAQGIRVVNKRVLIALPKPLIAHAEKDHFIALTRADERGVSYLCSDCGVWPGGRRDLTWAQWNKLEATLFVAVARKNSAQMWQIQRLLLRPAPTASIRTPSRFAPCQIVGAGNGDPGNPGATPVGSNITQTGASMIAVSTPDLPQCRAEMLLSPLPAGMPLARVWPGTSSSTVRRLPPPLRQALG